MKMGMVRGVRRRGCVHAGMKEQGADWVMMIFIEIVN